MGKKKNKNNQVIYDIYGIILIAFSLLFLISIVIKPTGMIGKFFVDFFFGAVGLGAYILPFITILIGIAMILNKSSLKIRQRFISIVFAIYSLLLLGHLRYSNNFKAKKLTQKIYEAYKLGINKKGGGIISELVDFPLLLLFGEIGSYIFIISSILVFLVLATEKPVKDILLFLIQPFKKINIKKKEKEIESFEDDLHDKDEEKATNNDLLNDEKVNVQNTNVNNEASYKDDFKGVNERSDNKAKEKIKINLSAENISTCNIKYTFPPIELLNENRTKINGNDKKELLMSARSLEETLASFGIDAKVTQVTKGPSVTRYELHPGVGVKVSKIVNLSDDIALNLAAPSVRIEAPIPGKSAIGIEVPNKEVTPVYLREVIESDEFQQFNSSLAFALGKDISGRCIVADIAKMPHLLIAGATGSGKSVCINTLITSLIYKSSPNDVKMLLIDPKVVELSVYNGIPHLIIPVVTEPRKAASALEWAVSEMTSRYKLFADNNVRNIESYNKLMEDVSPENKLPKIVIIIDELADLMMVAPNEVEDSITRLAQMARAAGIHLVIATQRPSVDVITGVIKANIPSRISFAVSSQIDSRTILDMAGAEKLLGRGDMLFLPIGENKPIRIQGAFISEKEVENIVEYLKKTFNTEYDMDIMEKIKEGKEIANNYDDNDELLPQAIELAIDLGQISASMLQRRFRIGFNRAARLIDEMEKRGIIGPQDGSKPRQVLIDKNNY
ncbi:DNA translocase FtsK 4TM domain-containing protein [Caloramator sp. CAR-1]|uniref:FtsK/SpoIIIE family DNA translocase n=1 Tax=Caloramator sp. CAR-1 TaxID=3062777 RepID=UPI0026E2F629|nr:DNA translocase FtsK [Caloramator sp. CAR-1]MDO6355462.1 DNA translocase FtsK 4TM domain-containing protein [Caloramator sp. CAR-1]